MAELANTQIQRLVTLVAWMSQRDTETVIPYRDAARALGAPEAVLKGDLKILVNLTDSYKSWLGSLSVAIVADGFLLSSRGAFRRPLTLSRDEALALILGLVGVPGGRALAARLGREFNAAPDSEQVERTWAVGPTPGERVAQVLALARRARDEKQKLELLYAGSGNEPSRRRVHVHQVVQAGGAWYLVAWCEKSQARRTFRAERILEAALLEERFTPHPGLKRVSNHQDLLSADGAPMARIAFSARIARWIRERYPAGKDSSDGRYVVELRVADPRWLAREVLQYGAEAEVLGPKGLREFVRGMVG